MSAAASVGVPDAPASKYAGLAVDARGHCSWFLTRTNKEHQATMEHPFMQSIYAQTFDRGAYTQYLAGQLLIFRELERLCAARRGEPPLAAVYDEALLRTAALERDLRFWSGADGVQQVTPSPQTLRYLERLQCDSGDAWMLVCHHFLQYNAVLSGGQFLGSMVSARALKEGLQSQGGAATGAEFYDFPATCQPTHARVQQYIDDMDKLPITPAIRDSMLVCMREIYALLLGIFDEVYQLAPVKGVPYNAGVAAAAVGSSSSSSASSYSGSSGGTGGSGGGGKRGPPPPPVEPLGRVFTLQELAAHAGQGEGVPVLTSVLGRVYDVSSGKEFFGPGGPYGMFAGHDGTYNLAVMSLKKHTLNKFEYELDDDDKECLADWIAYFDNKYGRPVGTLGGQQHAVSLKDLPRAQKIPFSGDDDDEAAGVASPSQGRGGGAAAAAPRSRL